MKYIVVTFNSIGKPFNYYHYESLKTIIEKFSLDDNEKLVGIFKRI